MNSKAEELGCINSHFTNPSGLHDENHYTTAYDLSLIARYAMNFEKFREIVTTITYTLPSTEVYPKSDRTFTISNALINPRSENYYEYATGIKTGYTNQAKNCLIASAKKDDVEFVIVVLGAEYVNGSLSERYLDCKTLFDFAFDNYTTHYQNLQQEKERSSQSLLDISVDGDNDSSNNFNFLRVLSKIIAIIAILLALSFIFRKKKKKNHYKYRKKKKAKHSK